MTRVPLDASLSQEKDDTTAHPARPVEESTVSTSQHRSARRGARRAGSVLLNTVLVLATLAGLSYLAPSLFGYERYVITGGSMSGTFEKGSVAFEKPVPVDELKVGDVITYQPPADSGVPNLVTHRIVSIKPDKTGTLQFHTKGDANAQPDPWTFQLVQDTQPVVQTTVPMLGWVFVALADRQIRMLAIGIPAGLIALLSLAELARGVAAARRERRAGDALEGPAGSVDDALVPALVQAP